MSPDQSDYLKYDTLFRNLDPAMQVVVLSVRVERFLSAVRDRAALAWLIRDGGEVLIDSGRKLPYGYYTVIRHYQPASSLSGVWALCLKPVGGKLLHPRVSVDDVKVQPDFGAAFAEWAALPGRAKWVPYLPGICKAGLGRVELLQIADLIDSDWGAICWDDYDSEGVPAEWIARHLRAIADNRHWAGPALGPNAAVEHFNRTGSMARAARKSGPD